MNVVFRADSSTEIGSGHVMRCLTLADELRARGADVRFICRELPGNYIGYIEAKGYRVCRLSESDLPADEQADWLIVDHYALDREWESRMRTHAKKIMVIDDLADRPHDCDLLLDQNLYENMGTRYDGLVPTRCVKLLGPRYALLRPEFAEARRHLRERDGAVRRILIFFGGGDPANETGKALEAVRMLDRPDIAVDVVIGAANPHGESIKRLCEATPNTEFHRQVSTMAGLMSRADLMLGAGGTTSWERCCMGLPGIMVILADNQQAIAESLSRAGTGCCLGRAEEIDVRAMKESLEYLMDNPQIVRQMSRRAFELCDGNGAARVGEGMLKS